MQSYHETALDFLGHFLVFLRGEEERSFRLLGGDPADHALFPTAALEDDDIMDRLHPFQQSILRARVPGELNEEQYTVATCAVETMPVFMWALGLWRAPDFFGQVTCILI